MPSRTMRSERRRPEVAMANESDPGDGLAGEGDGAIPDRRTNRRFDAIDARFDAVDARLDATDARMRVGFESIHAKLDSLFRDLDAKYRHLDNVVNNYENRLKDLEAERSAQSSSSRG